MGVHCRRYLLKLGRLWTCERANVPVPLPVPVPDVELADAVGLRTPDGWPVVAGTPL